MEITKEMYEKIAHLFPKQKSPPKISNLEALNVSYIYWKMAANGVL